MRRTSLCQALLFGSSLLYVLPVAAEPMVDGFLQTHIAARTWKDDCPAGTKCDYPWSELRGQIKLEDRSNDGSSAYVGRFDFLHDATMHSISLTPRELYGDLTGQTASLRAGRQVITWGVGDLLFINDIFPKDWVAMYTGQPVQNLKLGSDALKLNAFPGSMTVELVASRFRADIIPDTRRFIYADPLPVVLPRHTIRPDDDPGDMDLAVKTSGYLDNWELAGYASHSHYRTPAWRITGGDLVGTYPRLRTLGASLTGPVTGGVLSLEAGYYDSAEDRPGTDPAVENSQFRGLVGYSHQLWEDGTLGVQFYNEWMQDYGAYRATLPTGFPAKDRVRNVETIRFTQLFAHQTVTFNLFAFLGATEGDRYVIPSLRYALTDNLWAEVGANVFGGNHDGSFGSMYRNQNVYGTVRYAY